jgi:hypothetical protein
MIDTKAMYVVGFIFVTIAVILTIRELNMGVGWIISILLFAMAITYELLKGFGKTAALVLFALSGIAAPIGFFIVKRDIAFYVAIVVFFILSTYLVLRTRNIWSQFEIHNDDKKAMNMESSFVWFALILSSLTFSWATYFKFLTSMENEFIARRLVFTLFLIVVGIICSVSGRKSPQPFLGIMGLTFIGIGVAKALLYDTTHLIGFLRIAVFAGGGALLLVGGALMRNKRGPNV